MSILNQIKESKLSKKGRTSLTGKFEGTPANVASTLRGSSIPRSTPLVPPAQDPIDVSFNSAPQTTYLDYLNSINRK